MLETDGVRLRGALGRPDPSELLYPSSQGQNAPHGWNGCEPPARAALKRRSGRGGDQYLHRPGRSSTPLIRAPDWSAASRAHPIGRTVRSGPGLGHARVDARPRAGRGRGRGCTRPRKQNVRPTIEPGCAVLILEYSLQPDICAALLYDPLSHWWEGDTPRTRVAGRPLRPAACLSSDVKAPHWWK